MVDRMHEDSWSARLAYFDVRRVYTTLESGELRKR